LQAAAEDDDLTGPSLLAPEQIEQLLGFVGYGNPSGRFWFLGMEEQGAAIPEDFDLELKWRLSFKQVEDLIPAHRRWADFKSNEPFDPNKLVRTWSIMSRLVLRLSGSVNWQSPESVRSYQSERLGRADGETFLTELLPLPAPSLAHWPYGAYFPNRTEYVHQVLPRRLEQLRMLFDQHHPEFVFCYGKGYWDFHKKMFAEVEFEAKLDGRIQIGTSGSSTIVLCPFFAPFATSNSLISEVGDLVEVAH
jgi:hypothetical protein